MPYIKDENGRRFQLEMGDHAKNPGELNYQIFYHVKHSKEINLFLIKAYVRNFLGKTPNYQKYNDLIGCLVLCSVEIERRLGKTIRELMDICSDYSKEISDYEDKKIIENGDVD